MRPFIRALIVVGTSLLLLACGTATTPAPPTNAPPAAQPSPTALPVVPILTPSSVPTSAPTSAPTVAPTSAPVAKLGWSQLAATNAGPSARYDHSALVDPVKQTLVVFGGRGSGTLGDTWLFDLTTRAWREVKGNGPAPRFGHATVYDAAHRRLVLIMGEGANFYNDVWAFDLDKETWTQLSASGVDEQKPRPRYGQSAALDGKGRVIISHGFSDQGRFDDTWAFDLQTNQWINLMPTTGAKPLKRCLHELVYDAAADRIVLFGGCSSGFGPCPQGDLWAFDLKTNAWTELKPAGDKPSARSNPSAMYDAASRRIVLFGGKTDGGASGETWTYDLALNRWTKSDGSGPAARSSHDGDYDAKAKRLVIFGGQAASGASAEVWELKL
ncbi:MAG: kelch repeat-containing protein [Chloroflexota bacterium]